MKRIHFIAIGGAAMHSLALALQSQGYNISGSDDEINEPSKSRLQAAGLHPEKIGWFPEKITTELDGVILGMHARKDNPELLRAQEMGIRVMSYPEFVYEATKHKTRIVIGGSHGKTSITSMVLHILKKTGKPFDYLAGAQLKGFERMVGFSDEAEVAVIEGDEYLASPIDPRPKFHVYRPHIAVISGIAWDHINVFPTFESYTEQFHAFTRCIEPGGTLLYCAEDPEVVKVAEQAPAHLKKIGYKAWPSETVTGITSLITGHHKVPIRVFGHHNLMNLAAAIGICTCIGLEEEKCVQALSDFEGAARRLEKIFDNGHMTVFRDFAHSPSKLRATLDAVKNQFAPRPVLACMELHTFSSLNKHFLQEYKGCMDAADHAVVYFNPHTLQHKKLPDISAADVADAFGTNGIVVTDSPDSFSVTVQQLLQSVEHPVLLLMSSGTFDGVDVQKLFK